MSLARLRPYQPGPFKNMAEAGEISQQQVSADAIWEFLRYYLKRLNIRERQEAFTIMVVGETGTGKSSLINNLLGSDVDDAKEGDGVQSETTEVAKYEKMVDGVPVVLYDTPGLDDSNPATEGEHIKAVKKVLDSGKIKLVIYCQKLSETRMRSSLVRTFQQYHQIGVNWTRSVIALTFADAIPISGHEKAKQGFDEGEYFNQRLKEWQEQLRRTLVEQVGVNQDDVQKLKILPTSALRNEKLPNNKGWFVPLWLDILEILTPEEMFQLLTVQDGRVIFHITKKEQSDFERMVKAQYDSLMRVVSKCTIL